MSVKRVPSQQELADFYIDHENLPKNELLCSQISTELIADLWDLTSKFGLADANGSKSVSLAKPFYFKVSNEHKVAGQPDSKLMMIHSNTGGRHNMFPIPFRTGLVLWHLDISVDKAKRFIQLIDSEAELQGGIILSTGERRVLPLEEMSQHRMRARIDELVSGN